MRLLKRLPNGAFELTAFNNDDPPPYAILSHTWTKGKEISYNELVAGIGKGKAGYDKIRFCVEKAAEDSLQYSWVDTCCIDRSTSDELSTAINSMFRWYQRANKCSVYLSDVQVSDEVVDVQAFRITWEDAFRRIKWFRRGWTLQELLAPATVEFFCKKGKRLGSRISLEQEIYEITKIPVEALRGQRLSEFSVDERMRWVEKRETTVKEDKSYCLLGIFGVFMPLIYGEGEANASLRLREEVQKRQEGRGIKSLRELPGCISNALGLQYSFIEIAQSKLIAKVTHLRVEVPFIAMALQLQHRLTSPLCESVTSFGLPRIILDDSEYLLACKAGDLLLVQELFRLGKARPEDTSRSNMTPLLYASESGNASLVKFLLDQGARVDWTGGSKQTSALQWAIRHNNVDAARTLPAHGADFTHTNVIGWAPVFFCWGESRKTQIEKTSMLNLLAEMSCIDFQQTDSLGWTALQLAAAFGTAEDVNALVRMGADPLATTPILNWSSVFYAVDTANLSTFGALLPFYGDSLARIVDKRDWTLLHLAASRGTEPIIRFLLTSGGNRDALSLSTRLFAPEPMYGRQCTPEQVAEAFGKMQYELFLRLVGELNNGKIPSTSEKGDSWTFGPDKNEQNTENVAI